MSTVPGKLHLAAMAVCVVISIGCTVAMIYGAKTSDIYPRSESI